MQISHPKIEIAKKQIYDILNEHLDGATKIFVTHRLHLIDLKGCRWICIEDGSICEDDNSKMLLLKSTKFKTIMRAQK